jgi:phosphoserine aminotransferase
MLLASIVLLACDTDASTLAYVCCIAKQARLKYALEETRRLLGVPQDYLIGIVPASDTGAYEMAMWNMLGPRPIDACYWESFGQGW